jgi:membrane-associated phospholipid phosphatase
MTERRGRTATDVVMLAYVAFNTVFVLWHARDIDGWGWYIAANALTTLLVFLLPRAPISRLAIFIGGTYPMILTASYYTQLGIINQDLARAHDWVIQQWETGLFGAQVSVTWHQRMPNLALSWILHFCYGSYYWLLFASPLWLFFRRSRDAFERGAFMMSLALYGCYVAFALYPVVGPRYVFGNATGAIVTVLPARVVHWIVEGGSAFGTAFPSSHVATSWCAMLALWRDARKAFWLLAPVAFGLAVGTVFGQFHYAVDALAGAAVAVLVFAASDPLRRLLQPTAPGNR